MKIIEKIPSKIKDGIVFYLFLMVVLVFISNMVESVFSVQLKSAEIVLTIAIIHIGIAMVKDKGLSKIGKPIIGLLLMYIIYKTWFGVPTVFDTITNILFVVALTVIVIRYFLKKKKS